MANSMPDRCNEIISDFVLIIYIYLTQRLYSPVICIYRLSVGHIIYTNGIIQIKQNVMRWQWEPVLLCGFDVPEGGAPLGCRLAFDNAS